MAVRLESPLEWRNLWRRAFAFAPLNPDWRKRSLCLRKTCTRTYNGTFVQQFGSNERVRIHEICTNRSSKTRSFRKAHSRNVQAVMARNSSKGGRFGQMVGGEMVDCLLLHRSVDNGETIEHDGPVIIFGDVNQGGTVVADGDVMVWGRLQGHIHAGRGGDPTVRVFAARMEPVVIQIGSQTSLRPARNSSGLPEIAVFLPSGKIDIRQVVEEGCKNPMLHKSAALPLKIATTWEKFMKEPSKIPGNSRPAQVAIGTGLYIFFAGIALLVFPRTLFGLAFSLQEVKVYWVRLGATLAVVFGIYYIGTALGDQQGIQGAQAFYLSTVVGRLFLFLSFSWLVLMGGAPLSIFLVGLVNLFGAILMLRALIKPNS